MSLWQNTYYLYKKFRMFSITLIHLPVLRFSDEMIEFLDKLLKTSEFRKYIKQYIFMPLNIFLFMGHISRFSQLPQYKHGTKLYSTLSFPLLYIFF